MGPGMNNFGRLASSYPFMGADRPAIEIRRTNTLRIAHLLNSLIILQDLLIIF
jgi:hypothetical protein